MTGVGIIGFIIIGLIAGYIAERVTDSKHSLFTNLIVGLIGSFVGGIISSLIGTQPPAGFIANLVVATLGAVLFLYLLRKVRGRPGG